MSPDAVFYFDLASPQCYLAAEQVMQRFAPPPVWEPVLAREGFAAPARESRELLEDRAAALGVQPLRFPDAYPFDSERAMLAATYAKEIGRGVAYAQAAFRQAFAGGHSLADDDHILIAAAACEMHPRAVLRAIERRGVRERLERAGEQARRAGVRTLPTVRLGDRLLVGEMSLGEAARPAEALAR